MAESKAEVLSPAGSFEGVCAAISAGADAIYLGGQAFSARRYAKNFSDDELCRACALAKKHGVKIYVTVNILLTDRELPSALAFCEMAFQAGATGFIVQDLGLATLLKEYLPNAELHASTQMTVHSLAGALELKKMGFSRVVLSRELSKEEIAFITKNCGMETEVFVHGALCYCYSGQCLMSAVIGRRSGNRGACAQPCRLPYRVENRQGYFLSLKDLCLVDKVQELTRMGVASLKIEGRMKRAEYVGAVTRIYAKASRGEKVSENDKNDLARMFSRNGFTDGYYSCEIGREMLGRKGEDEIPSALLEREKRAYQLLLREPVDYTVPTQNAEKAKTFLAQKTGEKRKFQKYRFICHCQTAKQAEVPLQRGYLTFLPIGEYEKLPSKENAGVLFPVILEEEESTPFLNRLENSGATKVCIHNLGQISSAGEREVYFSSACNLFNVPSVKKAYALGATGVTASLELCAPQLRDMAKYVSVGLFAYGRIRLMTTENCVARNSGICHREKCHLPTVLSDRTGARFLVMKEMSCRNAIYNDKVIWLADRLSDVRELSLNYLELHFTDESAKRVEEVLLSYEGKQNFAPADFTRGMFDKKVF